MGNLSRKLGKLRPISIPDWGIEATKKNNSKVTILLFFMLHVGSGVFRILQGGGHGERAEHEL